MPDQMDDGHADIIGNEYNDFVERKDQDDASHA